MNDAIAIYSVVKYRGVHIVAADSFMTARIITIMTSKDIDHELKRILTEQLETLKHHIDTNPGRVSKMVLEIDRKGMRK